MKKLLALLFLSMCLGCTDATNSRQIVGATFPDGEVQSIPGSRLTYLIRQPDGAIWYVECMHIAKDDISAKVKVFGPCK